MVFQCLQGWKVVGDGGGRGIVLMAIMDVGRLWIPKCLCWVWPLGSVFSTFCRYNSNSPTAREKVEAAIKMPCNYSATTKCVHLLKWVKPFCNPSG